MLLHALDSLRTHGRQPGKVAVAHSVHEASGELGDELLRGRLDLLDVVDEGIGGAVLDEAGVAAWLQGLNMIRLVLGERLELDGADLAAHELPDGPATVLYEWTGELLEFLVRAASSR